MDGANPGPDSSVLRREFSARLNSEIRSLISVKRVGHVVLDGVEDPIKWGSYDVGHQSIRHMGHSLTPFT